MSVYLLQYLHVFQKAGVSLKTCEQKMTDIRSKVRCAQQKKNVYGKTVAECEVQIAVLKNKKQLLENKYEMDFENVSDSEVVVSMEVTDVTAPASISDTSSSLVRSAGPQQILEVEPISDAEDTNDEDNEIQQAPSVVVEPVLVTRSDVEMDDRQLSSKTQPLLVSTGSSLFKHRDKDKRMECDVRLASAIVHNGEDKSLESDVGLASTIECRSDDKSLESDAAGLTSVSKEVVVRSSDSLVCRPPKLDKMLNVVLHGALKYPYIEMENESQPPSLLNVSNSNSMLSIESNVQPLLNSVMSSLTQQSFNSVRATVHTSPVQEYDAPPSNYGNWYTDDSNLDSHFHSCTEDSFTVSRDDHPLLVLPMVIEGELELGIQSPSISTIAMEAVTDGLIKHVRDSIRCPSLLGESAGACTSGENVPRESDESCHSFVADAVDDLHSSPQSLRTGVIPSNFGAIDLLETGDKQTDRQLQGDRVEQTSKPAIVCNQVKINSSIPSIEGKPKAASKSKHTSDLSKGKFKLTTDLSKNMMTSTTDSSLNKPKPSSQNSTTPNIPLNRTDSKSGPTSSYSKSVPPTASSPVSKTVSSLIEGKSKPVNTVAETKPVSTPATISKSKSVIGKTESNAKTIVSVTEGKPKLAGKSVRVKLKSASGRSVSNPKPGVGLPDNIPVICDQSASVAKTAVDVALKAADVVHRKPEKIKTILQKHIDQIEEVKGQLAVAKGGLQKMDPTETCARTSGLRVALLVNEVEASATGPDEGLNVAQIFIKKIILVHDCATLVSKVGSLEGPVGTGEGPVGTGVPLHFSVHELLSSNSVIKNPSLSLSPFQLSENVLDSLSSSSSTVPVASTEVAYKPYHSPLLMFGSYRLSPNFSSSAKAPLSSITYSNKLDPNRIMCRFELTGTCSDSNCTAQHMRDVEMTKEDLVQDLVSYCPTLAGCTDQELADIGTTQTESTQPVSGKLSSYSSKFLNKYAGKVSDEELWKLVVYDTNKERMKTKPRREVVSFEDRPWAESLVASNKAPSSSRSLGRTSNHPLSVKVEQRR